MAGSLEKWRTVLQQPRVVEFFRDLFEKVGVRVTDTAEVFTCIHRGDRIEFAAGIADTGVDYVVEIESAQVDRLAREAGKGDIDLAERYRVMAALFTPATAAVLRHPVLAGWFARFASGAEETIHVVLDSPVPGEPDTTHTLTFAGGRWRAEPGLHGQPGRLYHLDVEQAVIFQKRIFSALKANRMSSWLGFFLWYRSWRKSVSSRQAA